MTPTREHGSLGDNIKVHFAGAENSEFGYLLHDAGVNYFLFTVLPFIMDQFGVQWGGRLTLVKQLYPHEELPKIANHVIMDSGLFSIMFGACKNVNPDEKFIRRYKDAIVEFVHQNKAYGLTCVECDCQKLLGTDLAWELRTQMRDQIPNRIINVFHFEDGKKGLDRMIEFSEYIAISVPELRIVKPKTYKEDTYRLASYIKEKKPEIDIHLLGGTEFEMVKRCKFCTSADSTSWLGVNRFGNVRGNRTRDIRNDKKQELKQRVTDVLEKLGIEVTEKRADYFTNFWLSGHLYLNRYNKFAGSQD